MTIDATRVVFPNNVVNTIADYVKPQIDADLFVVKRPLRPSDGAQSVGIFASLWTPDNESFEMGRVGGFHEPTLGNYLISIQTFIRDMDEARGLAASSVLSTLVRTMLHRNVDLNVALRSLSVVIDGSEERTKRYSVRTQRFHSNEIDGNFLYVSTLEFWLETERS